MQILEFLEVLERVGLPQEEFYILGDGSLMLYGFIKEVNEINLCITKELFEKLVRQKRIDTTSKDDSGFYKLSSDRIKVISDSKENFKCINTGIYNVENLRMVLKNYKNYKTDKSDIKKISGYLNVHPEYPSI